MPTPILLEIDPVTKWAAICLTILTVVYAVVRPFFRRKDPLNKPPVFSSLAQQRSVERQMQNVLVELSAMSRQITAQLDTRAAKLEALIREADEKIAAMKSASAAPASSSSWTIAPETPPPADPPESRPLNDPRHAQVYALADEGRSSMEIAQQLNRPSGEIELILALRR